MLHSSLTNSICIPLLSQLVSPDSSNYHLARRWYKTITDWLTSPEMGYVAGKNEPCVFTHPVTGHTLTLFVDDILCRGSKQVSEDFYAKLAARFDVKAPHWLTEESSLIFTGLKVSQFSEDGIGYYSVDQGEDMIDFLEGKGLSDAAPRSSPMPDKAKLEEPELVSDVEATWCRSAAVYNHGFYQKSMGSRLLK